MTDRDTRLIWWICTTLQLIGVFLLASHTVAPSYCYVVLLLGSSAGIIAAFYDYNTPLVLLNLGFTASNMLGIVRWS